MDSRESAWISSGNLSRRSGTTLFLGYTKEEVIPFCGWPLLRPLWVYQRAEAATHSRSPLTGYTRRDPERGYWSTI